jgi:hypothetical protein
VALQRYLCVIAVIAFMRRALFISFYRLSSDDNGVVAQLRQLSVNQSAEK